MAPAEPLFSQQERQDTSYTLFTTLLSGLHAALLSGLYTTLFLCTTTLQLTSLV